MKVDLMEQIAKNAKFEPAIAGRRVVVPARLSEVERAELSRQLYAVHRRIFAGVSAENFRCHVIDSPAEATAIQLYLSAESQIVGYCAVHRYRRRVMGRNAIVIRAEAGLMPEYRGRGATYGFGIMRAMAEKLKHPFTPIYYLGTLVHTSSYHLFCKYFPRVYPHPDRETSSEMQDIMRALIESFPDPAASEADPFVRDVGWVTIEAPQERALNQRDDRRDIQFFKSRNPGYPLGHGLVVVVPMTAGNIAAALVSRLYEQALIALGLRRADL